MNQIKNLIGEFKYWRFKRNMDKEEYPPLANTSIHYKPQDPYIILPAKIGMIVKKIPIVKLACDYGNLIPDHADMVMTDVKDLTLRKIKENPFLQRYMNEISCCDELCNIYSQTYRNGSEYTYSLFYYDDCIYDLCQSQESTMEDKKVFNRNRKLNQLNATL